MSRELVRAERRSKINTELTRFNNVFEIANQICSLDYDLRTTCILDIECVIEGYALETIVSQSPWMTGINMEKLLFILKDKGVA